MFKSARDIRMGEMKVISWIFFVLHNIPTAICGERFEYENIC